MEILIVVIVVLAAVAIRQSVRAERREAETRRLIKRLYGGGE
jgi:hypothetical protein